MQQSVKRSHLVVNFHHLGTVMCFSAIHGNCDTSSARCDSMFINMLTTSSGCLCSLPWILGMLPAKFFYMHMLQLRMLLLTKWISAADLNNSSYWSMQFMYRDHPIIRSNSCNVVWKYHGEWRPKVLCWAPKETTHTIQIVIHVINPTVSSFH